VARMDAPRFLADAMLARLARWLRVLDFDTAFDPSLDDAALVRLAAAESRVLLTRDRTLLRELSPRDAVEVRADAPLDQLRQLVEVLALAPPRALFTRCLVCNAPLSAPLDPTEAAALVPPSARDLPGPIRRCPSCGRVYWLGSHTHRMRRALEGALPGWLDAVGPGSSRGTRQDA
jgi:uncharacterized protein